MIIFHYVNHPQAYGVTNLVRELSQRLTEFEHRLVHHPACGGEIMSGRQLFHAVKGQVLHHHYYGEGVSLSYVQARKVLTLCNDVDYPGGYDVVITKLPKANCGYLPNGVELPEFKRSRREQRTVAVAMRPRKLDPNYESMRKELEKDGTEVIFMNGLERMEYLSILSKASVFWHPVGRHHRESCPTVILEAMALGLPVVAPAQAGIVHLVHHGGNGFLYPEPEPQQALSLILQILNDGRLRRTLSRAAVATSKKFRWDKICEAYRKIYRGEIGE